jgi:hypothetical protein
MAIYVQKDSPGKEKESNWLPTPNGSISIISRLYGPDERNPEGEYKFTDPKSKFRKGFSEPIPLAFAPYGREPRLLVARESRRAVVMPHLEQPGSGNVIAPGVEIEEAAIAVTA